VEARSTGRRNISQYLAKYLSKSFHLRQLYQAHGLTPKHKTYRFFKHLYTYETKEILIKGQSKFDAQTNQFLAPNQHIFRRENNTYYFKAHETLVGHCAKPLIIKRNYRLAYHNLSIQPLLKLAQTTKAKESLAFKKKLAANLLSVDFQEYLLTSLLLIAKKAQFLNLPLEQTQVSKSLQCDQLDYTHFQKKPILLFKFAKTQAEIIRNFMFNLDNQALTFDLDESQNFQDSRFSDSLPSRKAYLNH
jgi:hypothetical protein